jgi:radical SAM superfamily enzyme YgiQ (UPF0313 family)
VVDEMQYLRDKIGVEFVKFFDDEFSVDRKRAIDICDEIVKRKLDMGFLILSRVDTMDRELLRKLRTAGCEEIQYGVETASDRLIQNISKGIEIDDVEKILRWTKENTIRTFIFLMQGLPGETVKDIEKTFAFIKRNRRYIDTVESAITHILPGTPIYHMSKELGLVNDETWFSYHSETDFLFPNVPPFLGSFSLDDLIRYHKLTYILWHLHKDRRINTISAIAGYLKDNCNSPKKLFDIFQYLSKYG